MWTSVSVLRQSCLIILTSSLTPQIEFPGRSLGLMAVAERLVVLTTKLAANPSLVRDIARALVCFAEPQKSHVTPFE